MAESSSTSFSNFSEMPMFIPNKLRSLLSTVKKISEMDTLAEVLEGMQAYIYKNRLFDNRNPHIVHCENDALKDVLGVDHFTLYEIRRLLFKVMLLESPENFKEFRKIACDEESIKRKAESIGEERKRVCGENSGLRFCSPPDVEIESIEMTDSSDDNTDEKSSILSGEIFAVNHTYDIEYEVETDSSSSFKSLTDSDSEFEDVKLSTIEQIIKVESDIEFWADMSSDDHCESDAEIPESDKWICVTCGSKNKPLMRYCLKCWAVRKDWSESRKDRLERRSKAKSRRKKESALSDETKEQMVSTSADLPSSQESMCSLTPSQESICSLALSQESMCSLTPSQESMCSLTPSQESACSAAPSQDCPMQSSNSPLSSMESCSSSSSLCILCCEKPKNATVVHGNSGHQFSCYRCARKLLSLNKPCPICRKNIERVIHQIFIG